jgi:predicted dehydrogenase
MNPSDSPMPRRRFLGHTAALGAYIATTRLGRAQNTGGVKRLGIGFIGCGGRAGAHLGMAKALRDQLKMPVDLVACCDIYRPRREKFKQAGGLANAYDSHRKLLEDPAVDLVCIATPDHHHVYQAIDAVKAGKHVYCEKPISHWSQYEPTRALADAVAASKVAFVCGTQAMSDPAWGEMKKLIGSGLIGQPLHAETGFFRTGDWGERGMPVDDPNVKPGADLDWEAFLAPDRPKVPFSVDRLFRWRLFADYAGGPVTDLYPHCLAQVVDMLGLGFPERVTGIGNVSRYPYELRDVPDTFHLIAQFPKGFTLTLQGTQGNNFQGTAQRGAGQRTPIVRGWDGTLSVDPNNKEILFRATEGSAKTPAVQKFPIPGNENNLMLWKNLVECALAGRTDTWSPMDLAFRTQTILQMAMFSNQKNQTATFDPAKRAIII